MVGTLVTEGSLGMILPVGGRIGLVTMTGSDTVLGSTVGNSWGDVVEEEEEDCFVSEA